MWKKMLKGFIKNVCEEVKESNIGDRLRQAGEEIKAQLSSDTEEEVADSELNMTEQVTVTAEQKATVKGTVVYETADAEVALTVPAEDGPRGEFMCMDEKGYSYLIPKDQGFIDEGNSHAAEIHQAYGYGKMVNYEYDAMICFSIAPEFDCEIKENRAKAAYTRYDSSPIRSKLMTVEHPLFTHAYLFETPRKYRITYLKQLGEYELLGCELVLKKSGGDDAWKAKMIEEFKRFAGSCREV